MTEKKCAMRFFKIQAEESNDEVNINTATITKTKSNVFQLVCHYVACRVTFQMTSNLIGAPYGVLANPSMRDYGDHLVVRYVSVQCAANFLLIMDLL